MVVYIKVNDLERNAIASIVLKLLAIVCMVLTIFLPILTIDFKGSGVEATMTFYSFTIPIKMIQGYPSTLPSSISSGPLIIYFILIILGIILAIVSNFIRKDRLGGYANSFSVFVLFILFLNYYVANGLNNQTKSGVTLTVVIGIGYYFLIIALLSLFVSFFTKFDTKSGM